jgi:hypothetical protein
MNELEKELTTRGTAEITNGVVSQVTQALDESENRVKMLVFGELVEHEIMPIDEACSHCNFWKGKYANTKCCQTSTKVDAEARGFIHLICPEQFK